MDNNATGLPLPSWMEAIGGSDADVAECLQRHLAESHVSAGRYSRSRRLALGAEMLTKTRIYLDLKYWIYCRDAAIGRPQQPIHAEIWSRLRSLVECGRAVCPITYPILAETFKQGDMEKRRCTASVVDELSLGVAIQPFNVLVWLELYHLIESQLKGSDAVFPRRQLAWTYASWVVGEPNLDAPDLNESTRNAIQKCMFDILVNAPFSTIIEATAGDPYVQRDDDQHCARLNAATRQHQHEVTSFNEVYLSEVSGFLDTVRSDIADLWAHMYTTETRQAAPASDSPESVEATRLMVNFIYHAFRLGKWSTGFPALHIVAGIHAAVRHRRQPYKRGDHWDHLHAHAALGYCNAFFTEKNLGSLLSTAPLEYAATYGCNVFWDDEEALRYLKTLA